MPKRIPDLKNRILENAKAMLLTQGYGVLSMRALAQRCEIACGTLYNYYSGKDALVADIILMDWQKCLARMAAFAQEAASLAEGLSGLCRVLTEFTRQYQDVWAQHGGGGRTVGYAAKYHRVLREQLAAPICEVAARAGAPKLLPIAGVLAETMLACALNDDLGADQFDLLASALTPVGILESKGDLE